VKPIFAFCSLCACLFGGPPEIRGVWVARDSLGSRERIAETMENLKNANFNAAFVNVWSRGYPLWQSDVFERLTGARTDPDYADRDVLQEAIDEAKSRGLAVVPWAEYGLAAWWAGRGPAETRGPILDARPQWIAQRRDGSVDFVWGGTSRAYWLAHANLEAQQFMIDLMAELAANYEVPAIQFDRARYPELDCGYDDATRARYAADHDGGRTPDDPKDPEWMRWRADKLNEFVAEMTRQVKAANWRVLMTNAPIVFDYSYRNFLQEYPAWWKQKALDFVSPQIYRANAEAYERELDLQIHALEQDASRLVPGIDVTNVTAETLVRAIEITREKRLPGFVVWYYGGLANPAKNALEKLRESVLAQPAALPWK
jgi:uncharacterized lipoprotein YddW (UPF0748 family)